MFAVIRIAGQQFRVAEGQSLYVPQLDAKTGDKVEFTDVLMLDSADGVKTGDAAKATVSAEVLNELIQGDKVIAFKMKRRKGFRKKRGHRTHYSHIKVQSIA